MNFNQLHLAIALSLPMMAHSAIADTIDADLLVRGNAGDAVAQRAIGEKLLHGDGTVQNTEDGVQWLRMAAKQGDSEAEVVLGDFYLARRDDVASYNLAVQHLQRAAQLGNLQGADTLVQTLIEHALRSQTPKDEGDKEIAAALPYLKPSIARRNQTSCFYAGYLSFLGRGVPHNSAEAEKNMRCAADQGHAMAAFWVAGALLADVPTPIKAGSPKVEEARAYLKTAAERGHVGAAQLLSSLPEVTPATIGRIATKSAPPIIAAPPSAPAQTPSERPVVKVTVPRVDPPKPSAPPQEKLQALPLGKVACDTVANDVSPTDLQKLQAELDAANQKIARLQEQLAAVRNRQEDVIEGEALNRQALAAIAKGDYATAIPKLRTAVELGDVPATANLGLMLLQGTGVQANATEAVDLLERAANEGNRTAAENLGRIYESGIHLSRDITRAVDWYRKAQTLGSARALPALKRLGAAS